MFKKKFLKIQFSNQQFFSPYQMMIVSFNSNTTAVTGETGTVYPSGAPEFIHDFSGVRVA